MPTSGSSSASGGGGRGRRLVSPFVWSAETHYGRGEIAENARTHNRMVFKTCRSKVDCRMDGSKYVGRSAYTIGAHAKVEPHHGSKESGAWNMKCFRERNELWKPQPDVVHRKKVQDEHAQKMIDTCKPSTVTQLHRSILDYTVHRRKHPNFIPKPIIIAAEQMSMDSHDTFVRKAPRRVETRVDPWCERWVQERKDERYTKSGSLKVEFRKKSRSANRRRSFIQPQQGLAIDVPDRELLPAKRLVRPQSVPASMRTPSSRPAVTSHEDFVQMMSSVQQDLNMSNVSHDVQQIETDEVATA